MLKFLVMTPSCKRTQGTVDLRTAPSSLRSRHLLVRRLRHSGCPCGVAQLQQVAAGVEEVELPSGEEAVLAVNEIHDGDAPLAEKLAGLLEDLRAHRERVVEAVVLLGCPDDPIVALAEQDRVTAHGETTHPGVTEATLVLEAEHVAVESLCFFQVVDRDRPVGDAIDLQHAHSRLLLLTPKPLGLGSLTPCRKPSRPESLRGQARALGHGVE